MGLFGTTAPIIADLNLILQYVTLILLIFGYLKRKPRKTHAYVMTTMYLITITTTVLIMAPALILYSSFYGPILYLHAGVGIVCILLGTLFVSRFVKATRNKKPLVCGTKNVMRMTFILWLIPILSGTAVYITMYL